MIRILKKIHYVWILILTSLETYNLKKLMEQNISPVFYPSYKDEALLTSVIKLFAFNQFINLLIYHTGQNGTIVP